MKMDAPDRLAQLQAVVASLFKVPVAVAVTDPRQAQPAGLGDEDGHLARAFPVRKREFAAGRTAARAAMAALGLPPAPIPAAPDRAPIWPDGLQGSISHSATLCVAAITTVRFCIGVDIEPNCDLAPDLIPAICSDAEIARIAGPDQARLAKLVFCAKEAVYKAQYPLTGVLLDFHHIDIAFDLADLSFAATFMIPVGEFCQGHRVQGRFDGVAGHLVTAVTIDCDRGA